jgi:P4 family phage/plasmid primase-like protien
MIDSNKNDINLKSAVVRGKYSYQVPPELKRKSGVYFVTIDVSKQKWIIDHDPVRPGLGSRIESPITGYWEEFDMPDIKNHINLNFEGIGIAYRGFFGEFKGESGRATLEEVREGVLGFIYNLGYNPNEKGACFDMIEGIKTKNTQRHEQMIRQDAPGADKIVRETTEHILSKYRIATVVKDDVILGMLYYKDGVYVRGVETIIDEECEAKFQYDMSNHLVQEITGHIIRQTRTKLEEFDADPNIINVKNGLYHIRDMKLIEHRSEYFSLNQKPVVYDPDARPQYLKNFLDGVLYPSQIRTMLEALAYTFYRENPHEIFITQVGYGWNGKGVMMNVLAALHGEQNVSRVPLRNMKSDPFALSDLEAKDVNIDDEMSNGVITDLTLIKKLTGKSPTRVNQKYVKAHNAKLHAKLFFSTNEVPDITDNSVGRYRREVIILYPFTFATKLDPNNPMEKLEDPHIEDKLTTPKELSGIFNVLMSALHRVIFEQNKRVHIDMETITERRKHREILKNPIRFFIDEVIESAENTNPEDKISKDELHTIYRRFCELNKISPVDKQEFGKKFKHVMEMTFGKDRIKDGLKDKKVDPVTGKRPYTWRNLKVKPTWENLADGTQTSLLLQKEESDKE